jgi:hypothetical protein
LSLLIICCVAETPSAGTHRLSPGKSSIFLPRSPPAALTWSTASIAPRQAKSPHRAAAPDRGPTIPIFTVSPLDAAHAGAASAMTSRAPIAIRRRIDPVIVVLPLRVSVPTAYPST